MTTKDSSKRKLEKHIEQVEAKIADVDKKVSEAEGDLHTYYREALIKLKEVKQLADIQLERLQETGEETWDDLKEEVDDAIEKVRSNLDALIARFRDDAVAKPAVRRKAARKSTPAGKSTVATNKGKGAGRAKSKGKGASEHKVKSKRL